MDLLFLGISVAFFAAVAATVHFFETLRRR